MTERRPDYDERMARLDAVAKARTEESTAKAQRAITAMVARGQAINFSAVAKQAGVSKDFLYGHPGLASRVRSLRQGGTTAAPIAPVDVQGNTGPSEASARTQLTVLRTSNAQLRAEVEKLREENAALRGEVVQLRRRTSYGRT